MTVGTSVSGMVIAFGYGPIFALICLAYYPLIILLGIVFGWFTKRDAKSMLE